MFFNAGAEVFPYPTGAYVFRIDTTKAGVSASDEYFIDGSEAGFTYNYSLTSTDGHNLTGITTDLTLTFSAGGIYDITITGTFQRHFNNNTNDCLKLIEILQIGSTGWKNQGSAYFGCQNLISLPTTNIDGVASWNNTLQISTMFRDTGITRLTDGLYFASSTNLFDIFRDCSLSTEAYSKWLVECDTLTIKTGIAVRFVDAYYNSSAVTAKANLIARGWTFTDLGFAIEDFDIADIISEYKFENNVLDFVGSNDGTATGITYTAGLVGQTAVYDAVTDNVALNTPTGLSFGDSTTDVPFSISFLVKFDTVSTVVLINKKDIATGATGEYQIDYDGSSTLTFYLFDDVTNTNRIFVSVSKSFSASTWYHIAVTYDASGLNTGMEIYIDGSLLTPTRTTSGTYVAMHNTGEPVTIGKNAQSTTRTLDGEIDCVTFWNVELNEAQVLELATQELAGTDINP